MNYAIIAAGEGKRLAEEGLNVPKPLVKVGGECLVDRLIRIFILQGATNIVVLCNERDKEVQRHLRDISLSGMDGRAVPLEFRAKNTLSSMHSLYELHPLIGEGPFCLTTVDTVFLQREFDEYVRRCGQLIAEGSAQGVMGVTEYVDDEKPLYVGTDNDDNITGFYDERNDCRFVSAGIYGLTPQVWPVLEACVGRGERRMRNFQRALVDVGLRLKAVPFSKVMDVDHAADVAKADKWLEECHG